VLLAVLVVLGRVAFGFVLVIRDGWVWFDGKRYQASDIARVSLSNRHVNLVWKFQSWFYRLDPDASSTLTYGD
jgi:hypothetical protein